MVDDAPPGRFRNPDVVVPTAALEDIDVRLAVEVADLLGIALQGIQVGHGRRSATALYPYVTSRDTNNLSQ
jgi:hypothetical protein